MVQNGLPALGYRYVVIDDCSAQPQRDSHGSLVPDPVKFPGGLRGLSDYIHQHGMKVGLSTRLESDRCTSADAPAKADTVMHDAATFVAWGVDMVIIDRCAPAGGDGDDVIKAMQAALNSTGQAIEIASCYCQPSDAESPATSTDKGLNHGQPAPEWPAVADSLTRALAAANTVRGGYWNDPGVLRLYEGNLTSTEERSAFSVLALIGSPMLLATDLITASADTIATITNADVIALNQDPSTPAKVRLREQNGVYLAWRPLADGDVALGFFNPNPTESKADVDVVIDLGFMLGRYVIKDLWTKTTSRSTTSKLSVTTPGMSTRLYRISPIGPRPVGHWSLSDVVEQHSENGWGPYENSRSNGDQAIGDGQPLTIRGKRFARGLGVHSPSEIEYYLGGTCNTFSASVGVDDDVQGRGSVTFRVFANGKLVADSGLMTGDQPTKVLSAGIAGADTLKLVVTDGGDNIEFDHADWADAAVDCG
ncbi:alpha galactosidase [Mycobacteroides abscessus subsp. abscessus]|nr:alpha galactosidase [Mycobacteroides abscessus subsp. abscessus]